MIKQTIENLIKDALQSLSIEASDVALEHPGDISHGDYSTNAALVYGKKTGRNPVELALLIVEKLNEKKPNDITDINVAGPGFINFKLSKKYFVDTIAKVIEIDEKYGRTVLNLGKKVMIEYTDPNPFKVFHIGHLMTNTLGESLSRLIEWNGAQVKRACYQGDIGRHVALTIWGIRFIDTPFPDDSMLLEERVEYLGKAYAAGAKKFHEDEAGNMDVVQDINKKLYERSDAEINELYDRGKEWSLQYFERIYEKLGTKFDHYFFESEMANVGVAIVKEFLKKGIFEESDGAVVFNAEKYDPKLHTRVFINSKGLPTYEAKELGLSKKKYSLYNFDTSVVITANEQNDYFKVVLKALELIYPEIAQKTVHLSHGVLRLPSGKMSSRTGDVISAESLIEKLEELVYEKVRGRDLSDEEKRNIAAAVAVASIKYAILKQAPGRDVVFDFDKSLSFEGDSGPYLQYAYTRSQSVLEKAKQESIEEETLVSGEVLHTIERLLPRFPEIVERAGKEYAPQHIVNYLLDVAGAYNNFYAHEKIVDKEDPISPYKVALTRAVSIVMRNGLTLLGIKAPEKM